MNVFLQIKTVSESNVREHWSRRARRAKLQRNTTAMMVRSVIVMQELTEPKRISRPFGRTRIVLTRCSCRELDSDNLAGALKSVRDGVADALRLDDGDP